MEYGLIGKPLKHSFSKEVHTLFSNYNYDICEVEEDKLDSFMKYKNFKGINVTIPYKKKVIPYLDEIEDDAKNICAVNTVVNSDNKLYGYNTDFRGVIATLKYFNCFDKNYTYLILGTGATSNTIKYSLTYLGAKNIRKAYRKDSKVKGDVLYEDLDKYLDKIDFIINTTPNGMYPHIDDKQLIDITKFKNLKVVYDVIYNPLRTRLLIEAEKLGLLAISGLYMLVSQARFAYEYFMGSNNIDENLVYNNCAKYYDICLKSKQNIVLTGMPTCGKSTIGKLISEKYGYEFIDTDILIENRINMKISEFITKFGEEKFRDIESDVIKEVYNKNHSVISTGGGAILKQENVDYLKLNGKLFFINKPLSELIPTSDRPLTSNISDLSKKYDERLPIYKRTSDIEVNGQLNNDQIIEYIINN